MSKIKIIIPVITLRITPPSITINLCQAGFALNSQCSGFLLTCFVSNDSSIIPEILTKPPSGIEPRPYSVPLYLKLKILGGKPIKYFSTLMPNILAVIK